MPWSAPVNPVSGTVITVAYAVSNILDPLRWLRLMTGNADPPGTAYVIVSDSVTGASWKKVPNDALAAGVAVANLGYTPVNKAGDSGVGDLFVTGLSASGNVVAAGSIASSGGNVTASGNITTPAGTIAAPTVAATSNLTSPAATITTLNTTNLNTAGVSASGNVVADGSIASSGGNVTAHGNITTSTGTVAAAAVQATASMSVGGSRVWSAADFGQPTVSPGPGRIPIADAAGKLDAWVTASGGGGGTTEMVPGMVIGWTGGAGAIPGGWGRYTAADGRLLVGAGTSGEWTFTDGNSYGSTWAHNHTSPSHGHSGVSHSHSGAALGVGGTLAGPSSTGTGGGTGATFADGAHSHNASGLDVTGSTDATTAGVNGTASTVDATTILLPVRALIWIVKS
jgi:hypothetical protein